MAIDVKPSTWGFDIDPAVLGAAATSPGSSSWLSPFSVNNIAYRQEFAEKAFDIYNNQEALLGDILSFLGASSGTISSDTYSFFEKGRTLNVVVGGKNDFTSVVKTNATTVTAVGARLPFTIGDVLQVVGLDGAGNTGSQTMEKLLVTALSASGLVATVEKTDGTTVVAAGNNVRITVTGNIQHKGSTAPDGNIAETAKQRSNRMMISRRGYDVNLSDHTSFAWVNIDGKMFWTSAAMERQFARFRMIKEFGLLGGEDFDAASAAYASGHRGSQGLISILEERGNSYTGYPGTVADFDSIIKRQDEVGGGSNLMMFLSRAADLAMDVEFAKHNNVNIAYDSDATATVESPNYGSFVNKPEQLINLGFKGVAWNSYKFFKQTLPALYVPTSPFAPANRPTADPINGFMLPASMAPVYADGMAKSVPYMQVLHKAGNGISRELMTSIRGYEITGNDETRVDWTSEHMLSVAGANQMWLFSGTA